MALALVDFLAFHTMRGHTCTALSYRQFLRLQDFKSFELAVPVQAQNEVLFSTYDPEIDIVVYSLALRRSQ